MVQSIDPEHTIEVNIECFTCSGSSEKYVGWIKGKEFVGIVAESTSIGGVIKELGISLIALELYRKNTKDI